MMHTVARAGAPAIRFDRDKYGRRLLADACRISDIPGFIRTPDPHRLTFHEIALITDGSGALDLDGRPLEVAPYRLCITAPGETRSWRVRGSRLNGLLAFFETALFEEFFADPAFIDKFPVLAMDAPRRSILLARKGFEQLAGIAGAMQDELRSVQPDSGHVLRAQGYLLLTALQRHAGARSAEPLNAARALSRRFSALVEERFARNEGVADYAAALGVTARHLGHCVRVATGATPVEIVQRRLHLEARRLLLGTDLTIVEIEQMLEFSDPSYFSRFFRRHAGATPRAFRLQHGSPVFPR